MNTTELWPSAVFGPEQEEQVRHVGDGDAAVRHHAFAGPPVPQVLAAGALDVDVGVRVGDVETGGEHDDVDFALGAVGGDDAVAASSARCRR